MRVYDRVEFVRGERLEGLGHGGLHARKVAADDGLLQRIVQKRTCREKRRRPGDREDPGDLLSNQPRHIIEESGQKRGFRRAEHGQADARPLGIMGGRSSDWKSTSAPDLAGRQSSDSPAR
jgi:hypothetical protein